MTQRAATFSVTRFRLCPHRPALTTSTAGPCFFFFCFDPSTTRHAVAVLRIEWMDDLRDGCSCTRTRDAPAAPPLNTVAHPGRSIETKHPISGTRPRLCFSTLDTQVSMLKCKRVIPHSASLDSWCRTPLAAGCLRHRTLGVLFSYM